MTVEGLLVLDQVRSMHISIEIVAVKVLKTLVPSRGFLVFRMKIPALNPLTDRGRSQNNEVWQRRKRFL